MMLDFHSVDSPEKTNKDKDKDMKSKFLKNIKKALGRNKDFVNVGKGGK